MEDAEENFNLALGQLLMEEDELKYKVTEICPRNRFRKFNDELASSSLKLVYRAYDAEQGKEVLWHAIKAKRIPKRQLTRIHTELSLMKSLKHDNVLNCLDYWVKVDQREIIFITEMMDGGCLRSYLDKVKATKLKVIKGWCQQILKGLVYLHEQPKPVVHQSLRCDNIYINSTTNEVKLGQVGILFTSITPFQSLTGSYEWTAPQIMTMNLGTAADIYSFGMTLLQLATGKKPYCQCRNEAEVCKLISKRIKPKSLKEVTHPELKQLIQLCISDDPRSRPSARQLLSHGFWKPNQQIDSGSIKVAFENHPEAKLSRLASKSQKSEKEVKISQTVIKRQTEGEVRFVFQFGNKKKFEIKLQKWGEEHFQEFVNFLTKRFEDKQSSKQSNHPLLGYGNKFQEKQLIKQDHAHFLSCNNPTMKTMRFDYLYESRIKEDDNKKSTTNLSQFNEGAHTDGLSKIQQMFISMYQVYRNKLQSCHIQQPYQEARFLIEKKELDELQATDRQRMKLKKKGTKSNHAYWTNSINFIDFLNSSETPWPNEVYQMEKDLTLKHTLGKPEDVLSLNFSSIHNNREQMHADFELENARCILDEQDEIPNQKLNQSFIVQPKTETFKTKIPYLQLKEQASREDRQKQKQKPNKNQQQQHKPLRQLFQKKSSNAKEKLEEEPPDTRADNLI